MAITRSQMKQQIEKGNKMPKVGGKHFSYDKKGKAAAKKMAEKTGQTIQYKAGGGYMMKKMRTGGSANSKSVRGPCS
tara:strand:+ start:956 stop:1186 length:231 start_codon:yes stop_codon:yes gene_type:complete